MHGTRADEYAAAAREFRNVGEEMIEAAGVVARALPPRILWGGAVREALDDALGVIVQQCRCVARELDALALESARRAALCQAYEAACSAYDDAFHRWRLVPPDGREGLRAPVAPPAPAPWVRR